MFLKCIHFLSLLTIIQSFLIEDINKVYLERILNTINTTIDPCDDFYEYACGNWSLNYKSDYYVDMPGYMDYKVDEQLWKVLNEMKNYTGIYGKIQAYYESCHNLKDIALNFYLRHVQSELKFKWPIFREDWNKTWLNESHFDWLTTIATLRNYGLNGVFLTQNINVRLNNGSHYLLEIHQHQPRLELELKGIMNIFIDFGMTEEQSRNISEKIIKLENLMKNLTYIDFLIETDEDDKRYKESFQEMTIEELMTTVKQIDWIKYFQIVLNRPINITTESVQIFALKVDYFDDLLKVLQNTSNETICYYIMLKFMYHINQDISVFNSNPMHCIRHLRAHMPLAMNYLYEEFYYKSKRDKTDKVVLEIFQNLRNNFEKLLNENFLELSSREQVFILDELKTMKLKIGNVPLDLTQQFVENYYENITINATNFYGNHLEMLKMHTRNQQKKLLNQLISIREQFYEHDPETASSSSPIKIFENTIIIPYGYLQLPFFEYQMNSLYQYSLFGFIIAHEIIHAYDLFHIVYDQYGNYNDMGVSVAHHFWKYVDCFAQHPSDILSENIADVTGLRLAYQTYFDDVVNNLNDNNNLTPASGTNLTSHQLFFINSVQFLCADMEKISKLDVEIQNLQHDMHDIRVRQNWANFEQFALAFQCAKNTTMHPAVKCRLW